MTLHKRIRPFNTKEAYPEQKLDNDLSRGVVERGLTVFLRGQVARDLDIHISLHEGDAAKQTKNYAEYCLTSRRGGNNNGGR